MNIHNYTGIIKQHTEQIALKQNVLLANYSLFYQNIRGFHGNIKGDKFFELHLKFEELYYDLQLKRKKLPKEFYLWGAHLIIVSAVT